MARKPKKRTPTPRPEAHMDGHPAPRSAPPSRRKPARSRRPAPASAPERLSVFGENEF
jgi:hypothetical protein